MTAPAPETIEREKDKLMTRKLLLDFARRCGDMVIAGRCKMLVANLQHADDPRTFAALVKNHAEFVQIMRQRALTPQQN